MLIVIKMPTVVGILTFISMINTSKSLEATPNFSKHLSFYVQLKVHAHLIAASLNDFSNRWCKRENVEPDALKEWNINIFKIIDTHISFYSRNTHLLPPKPKSSFRHLKRSIQDFHMNYVLVPADKAANNVVVV